MGKHRGNKKLGITKCKLLPQTRMEISELVDQLFKLCTNVPQSNGSHNITQESEKFLLIFSLIEKIRAKENDIKLMVYDREKQIKPFLLWLKNKGVKMDGVEIAEFSGEGFGLKAVKDIPTGELILSVPKDAVMSEDTARKSYLAHLINKDPILKHMNNVTIALHLLGEISDPDSDWQPYLRILPGTFNTTLYFTADDLKLLVGSPMYSETLQQFQNIARQYSYFYRILHTLPEARSWPIKDYFTFDAYRWAVSAVMTRLNKIPSANSDGQLALIPAWDLANHEHGVLSTDFDEEENQVVCFAQRKFSSGEQFTIYYGKRTNAEFFLHSGFVYRDNPNDAVSLKLGVSKSDPLYEEKAQLLNSLSLSPCGTFNLVSGKLPISADLLCFTRIFCMDKESLKFWWEGDQEKREELRSIDCDVGSSVQKKTTQFLLTRVQILFRAYPTSLEEDEKTLKDEKDPKRQMISSLLVEEKKILQNTIKYLSSLPTK